MPPPPGRGAPLFPSPAGTHKTDSGPRNLIQPQSHDREYKGPSHAATPTVNNKIGRDDASWWQAGNLQSAIDNLEGKRREHLKEAAKREAAASGGSDAFKAAQPKLGTARRNSLVDKLFGNSEEQTPIDIDQSTYDGPTSSEEGGLLNFLSKFAGKGTFL